MLNGIINSSKRQLDEGRGGDPIFTGESYTAIVHADLSPCRNCYSPLASTEGAQSAPSLLQDENNGSTSGSVNGLSNFNANFASRSAILPWYAFISFLSAAFLSHDSSSQACGYQKQEEETSINT